MTLSGAILALLLIGLGFYFLRICSARFIMLRRAKLTTQYLWGIGGILSMMLITLAAFVALFLMLGPFH
jgi:hypothetical protein